jgi:hypothetical protein
MDLVLDVDAFWAWLLSRDEGSPVGTAGDVGGCPLACFLNEFQTDRRVHVAGTYCSVYDASGCSLGIASLPAWAERFVGLVDSRHSIGTAVSSRAALEALEQALQEVGNDGDGA